MKYDYKKYLEEGGIFFDLRLKLEEVAEYLGATNFDVIIVDLQTGPVCCFTYNGKPFSLNWDDPSGLLVLKSKLDERKKVIFYQDQHPIEIWEELERS